MPSSTIRATKNSTKLRWNFDEASMMAFSWLCVNGPLLIGRQGSFFEWDQDPLEKKLAGAEKANKNRKKKKPLLYCSRVLSNPSKIVTLKKNIKFVAQGPKIHFFAPMKVERYFTRSRMPGKQKKNLGKLLRILFSRTLGLRVIKIFHHILLMKARAQKIDNWTGWQ